MRARQKPVTNKCPFKDQAPHNPRRAATLTENSLKHIRHVIEQNGYRSLPYKLRGEHFYQCRDCHAVWLGGSPYAQVEESKVLGFYDHAMTWKPYPR
jgi:hypothetical protein